MRHRPKPVPDPEAAAAYDGPSKTQLKKAAHELQDLGIALLELPDAQLDDIDMDARLRDALRELRRLQAHHGAKRRQAQFVGKLLRTADPEPLRRALAAFEAGKSRERQVLHEAERWRDRLLAGDEGLTAWTAAYPAAGGQAFRTLVRNARREWAATDSDASFDAPRKGRLYREVFQRVREAMQAKAQTAAD